MNDTTKPRRNRAAYNRALKLARESYWAKLANDPDFASKVPWDVYRVKYIADAMSTDAVGKPGRKASDNQSPRQKYQQVYQRSRRQAESAYYKSAQLKAQFTDFNAYWAARKASWLPEGFLKNRAPLHAARQTNAKDDRSAYQTVYRHYRRHWEINYNECWQKFKTWDRYWAMAKANGFVPSEDPELAIDAVIFDDPEWANAHGRAHFSRLPKEWFAPTPKPAPITRPAPVAVYLEEDHEHIEAANEGWFLAA